SRSAPRTRTAAAFFSSPPWGTHPPDPAEGRSTRARGGKTAMTYLMSLLLAAAAQTPPPKGAEQGTPPSVVPSGPASKEIAPPKERHALILCGHPGDAEHVKSFTETIRKLGDGLA